MTSTLATILAAIGILGGLGGIAAIIYIVPTYRKLNAEAKKAGAEASELVAQSAALLLAPLKAYILELESQVTALNGALSLERRTSQETISGLRLEIAKKDRRLLEFEQHLANCGTLVTEGGPDA